MSERKKTVTGVLRGSSYRNKPETFGGTHAVRLYDVAGGGWREWDYRTPEQAERAAADLRELGRHASAVDRIKESA